MNDLLWIEMAVAEYFRTNRLIFQLTRIYLEIVDKIKSIIVKEIKRKTKM